MKINHLMSGFSLLLTSFVLTFFSANGQYLNITQSNPLSGQLEACQTVDTFTLNIQNISSVNLTNIDVLPTSSNVGVVYGGFVSVSSGTVTTISTNPMDFNIPSLGIGQTITLRYTAKAICEAMTNISGNTAINYANIAFDVSGVGRLTESLNSSVSYNLMYPRLDIVVTGLPQPFLDNAQLGDFSNIGFSTINGATRTITVTNNGTGPTDTLIIHIFPEPEIFYNGFSNMNGTFSIPANYVSPTEIVIFLTGSDLYNFRDFEINNDPLFIQGESILLVEDFYVIACGAENQLTNYMVASACFGDTCTVPGNSFDDGNVGVAAGVPNLLLKVGPREDVTNSYCADDAELTFYFTNTAADFGDYATNLLLDIIYSGSGFTLYDFEINGEPVPPAMITSIPSLNWYGFPLNFSPAYRIDLSSNTNPAIALDWDNDGQFDDLGAGQVLTLTAKINFDAVQPFESQCPIHYEVTFGIPQVKYEASCNATVFKTNARGQGAGNQYYASYIRTNGTFNGSITGTTDMVEGVSQVFEFCTGTYQTSMDFFNCPVDSFYAEIILPDGYGLVGSSSVFTADYGGTYNLNASSDGDTVTIYGGGHSISGENTQWMGCYTVELIMDCDSSSTGQIAGASSLGWRMNYLCDTCDIVQHRVCDDYLIYNHASCGVGVGCPGIVSTGFNADRTSFGYTDQTMTTKVTALTPGIDLNAAYPYDTVQTITSGIVNSLDFDELFCQIRLNSPDVPFNWLDAYFQLTDLGGTDLAPCPITTPPVITGTAPNFVYTFEIPTSCYTGSAEGFEVNLVANWQVNNSSTIFVNSQTLVTPFRSGFYSVRNDTTFACDEWGTDFKLYSINSYPKVDLSGGVGCDDLRIRIYEYNAGGKSGNDFPNEYRPVIRINDTITLHIPDGYRYAGNASKLEVVGISSTDIPVVSAIPITPVFIDADSVVFVEDWALLDKYNQNSTSDLILSTLQFFLTPSCERDDTIKGILDYTFDRYFFTENPLYYVQENYTYDPNYFPNGYGTPGYNVNHINPKANITVNTGAFIVDGYTQTVQWNITVCNKPDAMHPAISEADYVWIDLQNVVSNVGNITIDNFYETPGGAVQNAFNYLAGTDENSYVQLGDMAVNECKSFTLEGSYTGCEPEIVDTLRLKTGWNCSGYPDPNAQALDTASCQIAEDVIALRYKLANLDMIVQQAPTLAVDICDTLHYVVQLESNQTAFMYDVNFWAEIPSGASLINGQYNYIVSSNNWQPLGTPENSFISPNSQGWHLSQILSEWSQYDGGFIGMVKPDSAKIQIRFDIALNCDYNPADSIVLYSSGITNCGDSISLFNIQRLLINGFTNLDSLSVSHTVTDTIQCNTADTIHLTITNLKNIATGPSDSVVVYIPDGFDFASASSFAFIDGTYTATDAQKLIIPLSPSIPANGTRLIDVIILATDTSNCETFTFPMEIIHAGVGQCGNSFCPVEAVLDRDTAEIVVCCNPCNIIAEFTADTVCIGDTTCFRLSDQTTIGTDYTHSWDFGDGANSDLAEPCHLYLEEGNYTACHIVTQLSTGCADTICHNVVVLEEPHGSIVMLGCNPFCEGDTVYLTISGNYTSIEWLNLTDGISLGTNDTLIVTTSGTYTAALGNGYCVDTCLAITLTSQPLPEIEIADTMVCDSSDLVTLDAGPGFTTYEWSTGDTTQTITVGPGVYWVEVGEQLPFGCCNCKGRDTIIVSVSDLEVELNDTTICTGDNVTISPIVTGGTPPYTYLWSTGATTNSITVMLAGQYWVTVTDSLGCSDSDTMNLTLDLPPNAEFTYDDTICLNDTACYVAIETGIDSWNIYDAANTVIANFGDTSQICYHYLAVGNYTVEHILSNECGSDTVRHIITVVPPIEACIVMIGQNPFCEGDQVCLTVNDPFNQVTTIDWYLDSVFVGSMDTLCVTEPGIYSALVEDENGCTNACMCIVLTQVPVPVLNLPEQITLCDNNSETITAPGGFEEYIWIKDGSFYAYGDSSITVNEAGTYVLTVRDENGCEAIDSTIVEIFPMNTKIGSTSQVICRDETFSVYTPCNSGYTYSWEFRRVNQFGWTSIANSDTCYLTLTGDMMTQAGNYIFRVTVTDMLSGCTSTAEIMIIHQTVSCSEISIVPNPVLGNTAVIYYNLKGAGVQEAHFEIKDIHGNVIEVIQVDPEEQMFELNVTSYANGVYFVSLFADGDLIDTEQMIIAR